VACAVVIEHVTEKGYTSFVVQDLVIRAHVGRCECWQGPGGEVITAPLPAGIDGHFGPELRRFVLAQYHVAQTTMPAPVEAVAQPWLRIAVEVAHHSGMKPPAIPR
jgi:hypothetical protein